MRLSGSALVVDFSMTVPSTFLMCGGSLVSIDTRRPVNKNRYMKHVAPTDHTNASDSHSFVTRDLVHLGNNRSFWVVQTRGQKVRVVAGFINRIIRLSFCTCICICICICTCICQTTPRKRAARAQGIHCRFGPSGTAAEVRAPRCVPHSRITVGAGGCRGTGTAGATSCTCCGGAAVTS